MDKDTRKEHEQNEHTPEQQPAKRVRLCNCGEPAVIGVRRCDHTKYMTEMVPDLRRRLLLCIECWCKWEDEHGHRRHASAVVIG